MFKYVVVPSNVVTVPALMGFDKLPIHSQLKERITKYLEMLYAQLQDIDANTKILPGWQPILRFEQNCKYGDCFVIRNMKSQFLHLYRLKDLNPEIKYSAGKKILVHFV